jgi:hypothetical protein
VTRATYRFLDAVPAPIEAVRRAAESALGEPARLFEPAPDQNTWVGRGDTHVLYVAVEPAGRGRILLESRRLGWAREIGVPVPDAVAMDPEGTWLATALVADDPPRGAAYVGGALDAAERIAGAEPSPDVFGGVATRRAARWSMPLRVLRMAASPIDVKEFAAARRRAGALPEDGLAHGDFHPGNVLYDAAGRSVWVTDWEMLDHAPRGTDALTLWCGLDEADDRELVNEALAAGTSAEERRRLAALRHWLALRTLADVTLTGRRHRDRNHESMQAEAVARVAEARRLLEREG